MFGLPARQFYYAAQAALVAALWIVVRSFGGGDFFRHGLACPVVTRPSWAPRSLMLHLHQRHTYLSLCYGTPLLMAITAFYDHAALRLLTAFVASGYALAESSATTSHRDYPMVYISWALALLPAEHAEGVALGVCVHFVASSGLAKLIIGGRQWLLPCTMRNYLSTYGDLDLINGGPASPWLNRVFCRSDVLPACASLFTLLFECIIVPIALALPPGYVRLGIGAGMMFLHAGIFLVQSAAIGVFFIPNMASYTLGFGSAVEPLSPPWHFALLIVLLSFGSVFVRCRVLPEDWPSTPFALFAWNGLQWDTLRRTFETGQTRLVLSPDPGCKPVGLPIITKGFRSGRSVEAPGVYDAWNVCLADTTLHAEIFAALDFDAMGKDEWDPSKLTTRIEDWLKNDRLLELRSGRSLTRAFFVRVAEDGKVCEMLASGNASKRD
eukprot:TRINITY_DN106311_c0_g1_i1.p1 TRINITY_DN106311_c0_g1~~TRINITY_DN106311_c0_g1_i1.p1  ORF type:complete len:453 (-),score=49.27 TRINITY_DN106311_c0_g1_i1:156-1472(-)